MYEGHLASIKNAFQLIKLMHEEESLGGKGVGRAGPGTGNIWTTDGNKVYLTHTTSFYSTQSGWIHIYILVLSGGTRASLPSAHSDPVV